jgi:hypothetical protein
MSALAVLLSSSGFSQSQPPEPNPERAAPSLSNNLRLGERSWIAGRYDGNRVIVYFDAVKFNGSKPSLAEKIAPPVADGFFMPEKLPWSYIAKLQQGSEAEHFKMGDRYDLILGSGMTAAVTLTTMVGTEGDEPVGNDSYIGALATLDDSGKELLLSRNYYVVRRHLEPAAAPYPPSDQQPVSAGIEDEPVRFDIQTQILDLLTQRMQAAATESERRDAQGISPIFNAESFRVADGTLRYYARAEWKWGKPEDLRSNFALAAWIIAEPKLRIAAVQTTTSPYDGLDTLLPKLLNVLDLGGGRTGIILSISGEDSASTRLLEYHDGIDFQHMRVLQTIEAGE